MRLSLHHLRSSHRAAERGVALIVTIVLLSVITFLAIVFLALTGRETGSVKTTVNQTIARQAADMALERAKAELLARILATKNAANFGLLVSTNFYNYNGFDPGAFDQLTNVNYERLETGAALNANQFWQNLTNLYYSPRPPVYITNRAVANSTEFRYYLDLNRNGRYDLTGLWPATNDLGQQMTYVSNSVLYTNITYVIGDPQWIGGLDRPNQTHGPENQFLNRFAYEAVPIGNALDVNYINNNAKPGNLVNGYIRDQGVGSWEINLPAFLADLNTNLWNSTAFSLYDYRLAGGLPNLSLSSAGAAFDDAYSFWLWRRGGVAQPTVFDLYGVNGANAFRNDFIDGYSSGNLVGPATSILTDTRGYAVDPDNAPADRAVTLPWAGADLPNHYFSTQDLFDPTKTSAAFVNRILSAGTNASTYDRYTFSRLLEQMGTDSAPEDPGKLNLNYVNVGGLSATNFVSWNDTVGIQAALGAAVKPAELFFTNAVDRLLRAYTTEWLARDIKVTVNNTNVSAYLDIFQTDQPFGLTNIPVLVSNRFVYNQATHRVLQVAANLWETKNGTNAFPAVFRPVFTNYNNNVFIRNFVLETNQAEIISHIGNRRILDLMTSTNVDLNIAANTLDRANYLVYGVPLVIGAHKALPNFNEFQAEPTFTITRKVELVKPSATSTVVAQTNQFFTMTLTMPSAAEFWNSYRTNYSLPGFPNLIVTITNWASFTLTNDLGIYSYKEVTTGDSFTTNVWPRVNTRSNFIVMMRTNIPFLPTVKYRPDVGFQATNTSGFDESQGLIMPRWGLTISNRIHGMILDQNGHIIDYVLLGNTVFSTNLTDVFSASGTWSDEGDTDSTSLAFKNLWSTNQLGTVLSGRPGIVQQINISRGEQAGMARNIIKNKWKSYGEKLSGFSSVDAAIDYFNLFLSRNSPTNRAFVPFSPTYQFSVPMIWQANDPLVHYLADDLLDPQRSYQVVKYDPQTPNPRVPLKNIGAINDRYLPWAPDKAESDPDAVNPVMKDPGATSSDMWQFPANVLPSVGWLGRVHRGTPWQTIYLKASDMDFRSSLYSLGDWLADGNDERLSIRWRNFAGNRNLVQGYYSRPVLDRMLFDEFTTVLNDNAARGRLPINQSGLAAWSAVFSGVAVLSNSVTPVPYTPVIIEPAGVFDSTDLANVATWPSVARLWHGINSQRARTNTAGKFIYPGGAFQTLGDILSVPELTDASPFLNTNSLATTINDAAYEWLPQQVLGLLQKGEPRFVIYAYGQALQPAPDSIIAGGTYSGLCTNYAITAEVAARAVVRLVGSPDPSKTNTFLPTEKRYPPHLVTESYNLLGPD